MLLRGDLPDLGGQGRIFWVCEQRMLEIGLWSWSSPGRACARLCGGRGQDVFKKVRSLCS